MCQILGIVNIQNEDEQSRELIENVVKIMLSKASEGNTHGSGVALSYRGHNGFFTLKSPHAGNVLAKVLELDKTKPFKHILAHTRYATSGSISERNSHPHLAPTGALIHNGWAPDLYNSIQHGWHHNAEELQDLLEDFNEKPEFTSECDSEALALVFSEDPKKFASNLIGDEVFAVAHLDNTGNKVSLYTQYNTVHMAYSHALGAVIFCTQPEPIREALEYLGEVWPIVKVDNDQCYYFDGDDMVGHPFDFTEAAIENMNRYYKIDQPKNNDTKVYDYNGVEIDDERDDLDVYFKKKIEEEETSKLGDVGWTRNELDDGSVVWEHVSGEKIHCSADVVKSLEEHYANLPEESEMESCSDSVPSEFLNKDFEESQKAIMDHIQSEMDDKE